MPQCRMWHCKTQTGQGISMFKFPATKDRQTAEKWLQLCGIQFDSFKNYNYKNKFVCALHFNDSDYERDLFSELMQNDSKRQPKLKNGVVPSTNLPSHKSNESKTKARKSSVERMERLAKKRILDDATGAAPPPAKIKAKRVSSCSGPPLDEPAKLPCQTATPDQPILDDATDARTSSSAEIRESKQHMPASCRRPPVGRPAKLPQPPPGGQARLPCQSPTAEQPAPTVKKLPILVNAYQQMAPPVKSSETQTDWNDPLLIHQQKTPLVKSSETQTDWNDPFIEKHRHQLIPSTQSAPPVTEQPAPIFIQPPSTPQVATTPIKKDHAYFTPKNTHPLDSTPVPVPPKRIIFPADESTTKHADDSATKEDDNDGIVVDDDGDDNEKACSKDPDYEPSSSDESSSDEEDDYSTNYLAEEMVNETKYIVFESSLRQLLHQIRCGECGKVLCIADLDGETLGTMKGTMLTLQIECLDGHPWSWNSQPTLGVGNESVPAGNLLTSAAILFSGIKYTAMEHFASFMNLEFLSETSYTNHENDYLFPVVHESWFLQQDTLWGSLAGIPLELSGDGRCDSPGFSAKYCTYVMMAMDTGKVVDIETISVNEVSSSNAMEKEGCRRMLDKLEDNLLEVDVLCTDRHGGIAAMLRDDYPDINHQFDLWHLAKSTTKKLNVKAKKKECQELGMWMPSIRNHLWWASSSCGGDKILLLEKWRSIVYHATNQHEWGGTQKYSECGHTVLTEREKKEKKWLEVGSPAHEALADVVNDKGILKGVNQVNLFCHTGKTEVFNSSLLKFCPKRVHFPYEGMVVRTKLAAIDNNHNTGRTQARVKRKTKRSGKVGSLRYKVVWPKMKKKWIAKPIYEKKSYGYVYDMMAGVLKKKLMNKKGTSRDIFDPPEAALQPNIAPEVNPGKEIVVQDLVTRFEKAAASETSV